MYSHRATPLQFTVSRIPTIGWTFVVTYAAKIDMGPIRTKSSAWLVDWELGSLFSRSITLSHGRNPGRA